MKVAHVNLDNSLLDHRVLKGAFYQRHFQKHDVSLWSIDMEQELFMSRPMTDLHGVPHYIVSPLACEALPEVIFDTIGKPDVIVCHEVEALLAVLCVFSRVQGVNRRRDWPVHQIQPGIRKPDKDTIIVYDAHEFEPDRPIYGDKVHEAREDRLWIEKACIASGYVDYATAPSKPICDHLVKLGMPASRVGLMYNACYKPPRNSLPGRDSNTLLRAVFAGFPAFNREITVFVEACRELDCECSIVGPTNRMDDLYYEYCKHYGVRLTGPLPHWYPDQPITEFENSLLWELAQHDVGFIGGHDGYANHRYMLPNKLFEYATAKIPFVFPAWMPSIVRVSAQLGLNGFALESTKIGQLAGALCRQANSTTAVDTRPLSYDVLNAPAWEAIEQCAGF